jgi:hypothetical protein
MQNYPLSSGIHIKDRIPKIRKIARISNIAAVDILHKSERNPDIKRIVGSSIAMVRFHFIAESIITSVLSLGAALTAVQIFIGLFNEVAMGNINVVSLNRWEIWLGLFIGAVGLGIINIKIQSSNIPAT